MDYTDSKVPAPLRPLYRKLKTLVRRSRHKALRREIGVSVRFIFPKSSPDQHGLTPLIMVEIIDTSDIAAVEKIVRKLKLPEDVICLVDVADREFISLEKFRRLVDQMLVKRPRRVRRKAA